VVFLELIAPAAKMVGALPLGLLTLGSVVALAKLEGAAGLVEIPGLLSNVFSYLRLMALGVAGLVLAPIINQIPLDVNSVAQNPLNIIPFLLFAVMFAVFHMLHLLLATVEGGIQSIRLQYVEFFSKFYKGGGIPFVPLRDTDA
jgi:V/A-type H+-transporting ATPase subunit I